MARDANKKRLISELIDLIDADEAILSLLHVSNKETFKENISRRKKTLTASNNELRELISRYKKYVQEKIDKYGIRVSIKRLVKLHHSIAYFSLKSEYALVPKYTLDKIFTDYGAIVDKYDSLPGHIRFGIHLGDLRQNDGEHELHLLEQILHEDVCCLFNLAKSSLNASNSNPKYFQKKESALFRACVVASFNFVECYLNAIAFDFLLKKKKHLEQKEIDLLSEFDSKADRRRFVSLRDKLLKYPKTILALEHPPFDENNNDDARIFLEYAKGIRDAIVHAKPTPDEIRIESSEQAIYSLAFQDVEKIVDASINLVKKIESLVNPNSIRLEWLMQKGGDGYFAESSFE